MSASLFSAIVQARAQPILASLRRASAVIGFCPNAPRYSARQVMRAMEGESTLAQPNGLVSEPFAVSWITSSSRTATS